MSDEMKFCKDCKWFETESLLEVLSSPGQAPSAECSHKDAMVSAYDDPVWGVETQYQTNAFRMREVDHKCGPDALLFELTTKTQVAQ